MITIIGILGTIVAIRATPVVGTSRKLKAKQDLTTIHTVATTLYTMTGTWPNAISELLNPRSKDGEKLPGLVEKPVDPWGHPYIYELGEDGPVVRCLGKDNAEGGEGEDEDITVPASTSEP